MPPAPSPYIDPAPRGFRVVLATLRIVVALECWGLAASRLVSNNDFSLVEFLTERTELSADAVGVWLDRGAWGLVVCGALTLLRPCWPVLVPVIACFGLVAAASTIAGNHPITPASHAARYLTPLSLMLLDLWPPKVDFSLGRANVAIFLLRLGAAATFIGHGLQCLEQCRTGGNFVELITGSFEHVLSHNVSDEQARQALGVIGGLDIGLGAAILFCRSRAFVFYMALWGVLAAVSRVLAHGPDVWPMVLIRAANGGAPAALFLYWLLAIREQPPVVVPSER